MDHQIHVLSTKEDGEEDVEYSNLIGAQPDMEGKTHSQWERAHIHKQRQRSTANEAGLFQVIAKQSYHFRPRRSTWRHLI